VSVSLAALDSTPVASSKRERELARQRYERQALRREAARRRRQQRVAVASSVIAVLLVIGAVAFLAARGGSTRKTPTAAATPAAATPGGCAYPRSTGPAAKDVGVPPIDAVDRTTPYAATITLSAGTTAPATVTADLLTAQAPCTVNSFRYLAANGYFDGTPCHRLTTSGIFVLQCGDPSGKGSGGPGYAFADENLTGATYPAGTLAMANAGPGTNGSQFFVVYADTQLPPNYTPFGKVTAGLDAVAAIGKAGTKDGSGDGAPKSDVTIQTFTVSPKA
jgi:peptidyl-prolyl cis-trans isomerase B (cyclophilin B)